MTSNVYELWVEEVVTNHVTVVEIHLAERTYPSHKHLERSKEAAQNQLEKSEAHTQPRNKILSLALLQTFSSATLIHVPKQPMLYHLRTASTSRALLRTGSNLCRKSCVRMSQSTDRNVVSTVYPVIGLVSANVLVFGDSECIFTV